MSGNQLAKFFATVGFKVDTSEFDRAVKKVKKDVAGISKSVQSSTVAKQARSMRQNLRFEEQKAQYRTQEEAAMLKQAAFLNKEDTYKKKGISLREKVNSFAEKLRDTESAQALRNMQAKRTAAKMAEQASAKELSNMGDFYRKQEQAYDKLHQQALRENIRLVQAKRQQAAMAEIGSAKELAAMNTYYRKQEAADAKLQQQALRENIRLVQAKMKASAMAEKFRNSESVKALRNIQAKRQQAVRGEIGSAKELAAMNTYYRKQEQAYDKLHQQALKENIRLEQRRTKEANRRTMLQQRGARSGLDSMTTGAVGGMTARGAVGGLAAGAFAQQSFRTAQFSTAREPQFEFLTGSKEKAKEQIQFIDKEVDRLSLNLGQANEQYKNLLAGGGDAIGIEKTQKLFTSFSELSTMLGTSTDQQNRGLRAFTQMLSKGQVMA